MTAADRDPQAPDAGRDLLPAAPSGIPDAPTLLVAEVAAVLRCGRNQAYRLVSSGALRSVKVGRAIRVPRTALVAFLEGERS